MTFSGPIIQTNRLEMGDEIFTFESFINFLKYFKTPFLKFSLKFCILIIIY